MCCIIWEEGLFCLCVYFILFNVWISCILFNCGLLVYRLTCGLVAYCLVCGLVVHFRKMREGWCLNCFFISLIICATHRHTHTQVLSPSHNKRIKLFLYDRWKEECHISGETFTFWLISLHMICSFIRLSCSSGQKTHNQIFNRTYTAVSTNNWVHPNDFESNMFRHTRGSITQTRGSNPLK